MPELTHEQAVSLPAWKRERKQPLHGPAFVQPPRFGVRRVEPRRGPWQKLVNVALAISAAAAITVAATMPAHASEGCDMNSGPEGVTIGALMYVREVMDDAIVKYREYKTTNSRGAIQEIEVNNDFLCDLPEAYQPTLLFMTDNLLIWIIDILQM